MVRNCSIQAVLPGLGRVFMYLYLYNKVKYNPFFTSFLLPSTLPSFCSPSLYVPFLHFSLSSFLPLSIYYFPPLPLSNILSPSPAFSWPFLFVFSFFLIPSIFSFFLTLASSLFLPSFLSQSFSSFIHLSPFSLLSFLFFLYSFLFSSFLHL